MDILFLALGFVFIILGILGSFLPVLPGPPLSWVGLLFLYLTKSVPDNWWVLGITLVIAILILVLDYIIPVVGTKRFGGSKAGMIGTTVGLVIAIIFPVLGILGIIIWPFIGAFVGELINKADSKNALKSAFGSFIGFLTGTFLKFAVAIAYLVIFIKVIITNSEALFSF
ncbi:hypothetical protein SAMN04487906_1750 [Zhouia amylolytica]|uniref:DUF456 domain-containing protein n=2 Tax=Zhouia amylolytica TaxID=376730 RepID=W2UKI0_9FLAO|nr:DUF456 domain-containing protein [Zhouia amylolytica]ETN94508.1 hypothetical protein P278_24510 [Zhouia amylolytica AD3]MCQ0110262.1 DUF456 domain-containing protein [Zhouia amylolytica]SFS79422.1 hypothetical protein SAMN04487906_1750 [Zhouia amylolytica]